VKLRLYHHPDGARVAYREAGTGPPLVLLHSKLLSHREWEPLVEELGHRFRLVLPDLPLHGDSEDRRGERQPTELGGAEAADDGGVDEDVERLDREAPEGRQRQPEDPAVGRVQAGVRRAGSRRRRRPA